PMWVISGKMVADLGAELGEVGVGTGEHIDDGIVVLDVPDLSCRSVRGNGHQSSSRISLKAFFAVARMRSPRDSCSPGRTASRRDITMCTASDAASRALSVTSRPLLWSAPQYRESSRSARS